jgi:hypothetical protein
MSQSGSLAQTLDPPPDSWVTPGQSDSFATAGLITLLLILFLVVYLYAVFDRYASNKGEITPLRTTIPTMLTIGLAYDLVPLLEDVSFLLPLTLILAALALDITFWLKPRETGIGEPALAGYGEPGEHVPDEGPASDKTTGAQRAEAAPIGEPSVASRPSVASPAARQPVVDGPSGESKADAVSTAEERAHD